MAKIDLNKVDALTQWIGDDAKDSGIYAAIADLTDSLPGLIVAAAACSDLDRSAITTACSAIANTVANLRDVHSGIFGGRIKLDTSF